MPQGPDDIDKVLEDADSLDLCLLVLMLSSLSSNLGGMELKTQNLIALAKKRERLKSTKGTTVPGRSGKLLKLRK